MSSSTRSLEFNHLRNIPTEEIYFSLSLFSCQVFLSCWEFLWLLSKEFLLHNHCKMFSEDRYMPLWEQLLDTLVNSFLTVFPFREERSRKCMERIANLKLSSSLTHEVNVSGCYQIMIFAVTNWIGHEKLAF